MASLHSSSSSTRMRVGLEIHFPTAPIRNVGVELGSREIGMSEHLLNTSEVGAPFEQVSGERVPQQMRMDPLRFEAGLRRQPPQNQERPRPRQPSTLGIEEELWPVPAIEVRSPSREVAA